MISPTAKKSSSEAGGGSEDVSWFALCEWSNYWRC